MENEVKFKVKEVKKISDLLGKVGAKQYPKTIQVDYSFDTPDGLLSRQGKLLCLRKTQHNAVLTLKGPIVNSRFKKREEMNIELDDFKRTFSLLNQIGLIASFDKEKIRRGFKCKNTEVYLDKLPFIGYYLEIEGKDKDILSLIGQLGLDISGAIKESYSQLFNLFCIINQNKIKHFRKKLEFSFKCEREFKRYVSTKSKIRKP